MSKQCWSSITILAVFVIPLTALAQTGADSAKNAVEGLVNGLATCTTTVHGVGSPIKECDTEHRLLSRGQEKDLENKLLEMIKNYCEWKTPSSEGGLKLKDLDQSSALRIVKNTMKALPSSPAKECVQTCVKDGLCFTVAGNDVMIEGPPKGVSISLESESKYVSDGCEVNSGKFKKVSHAVMTCLKCDPPGSAERIAAVELRTSKDEDQAVLATEKMGLEIRKKVSQEKGSEVHVLPPPFHQCESETDSTHVLRVYERLAVGDLNSKELKKKPTPAEVGASLFRAVEQLHKDGVVHHDIKSANILVMPDGKIFLADLGLSVDLNQKDLRMGHNYDLYGGLTGEQILALDGRNVDGTKSTQDKEKMSVLLKNLDYANAAAVLVRQCLRANPMEAVWQGTVVDVSKYLDEIKKLGKEITEKQQAKNLSETQVVELVNALKEEQKKVAAKLVEKIKEYKISARAAYSKLKVGHEETIKNDPVFAAAVQLLDPKFLEKTEVFDPSGYIERFRAAQTKAPHKEQKKDGQHENQENQGDQGNREDQGEQESTGHYTQ